MTKMCNNETKLFFLQKNPEIFINLIKSMLFYQ